ncbi:TolC family protein [Edaphobacter aggregans]|uniref:TolC family protein n=1 Tax=Edaphobacter aggregans TaxID=570835 RepID=UPI0009FC64DB|nr:TolC family protein [Edaphobacter aggregans]
MKLNALRALGAALFSLASFAAAQTPPPAPPQPAPASAPLTLQQAVARALAGNPTLASVRQHVSAVESNKLTAGLRQNPTLTLYGQGITLPERPDTPDGNPFFYSANVSRLFERGQKRRWRLDSANATADSTQSLYRDQERQLTLAVRDAFTNMLLARASLAVADENLADYHKTVDLSKARLDAGDITNTDFERIDLQLAQFESDADNARLALQQASTQLQLLFGDDHPSPSLDITGTLEPPQIPVTQTEAENQALSSRPDYLAARQALTAAEANAKLAVAGGTADPTLATEYDRNGINNSFGLSLSIPVRVFDRNQGEKERTRYEVESSRSAITAARNQVVSDVDQAWLALETAQHLAQRYNSHYLAESEHVRDNLQFSYRNGNTTLLDYLSALRDYRAIHLSSLTANAQVWLALHQLSYATATDILP